MVKTPLKFSFNFPQTNGSNDLCQDRSKWHHSSEAVKIFKKEFGGLGYELFTGLNTKSKESIVFRFLWQTKATGCQFHSNKVFISLQEVINFVVSQVKQNKWLRNFVPAPGTVYYINFYYYHNYWDADLFFTERFKTSKNGDERGRM